MPQNAKSEKMFVIIKFIIHLKKRHNIFRNYNTYISWPRSVHYLPYADKQVQILVNAAENVSDSPSYYL